MMMKMMKTRMKMKKRLRDMTVGTMTVTVRSCVRTRIVSVRIAGIGGTSESQKKTCLIFYQINTVNNVTTAWSIGVNNVNSQKQSLRRAIKSKYRTKKST